MNVAVFVVGGVGGYFGGRLTRLLSTEDELKVYFIARNAHLRAIQEHGLVLDTEEGRFVCHPSLATDEINDLPDLDLILLCVKGYDLDHAIASIVEKVHRDTIILPLLNGIDVYDRVKSVIPNTAVLPACVYIGTHIESPGTVRQHGGACTIHMSSDPKLECNIESVSSLFDRACIEYTVEKDVEKEIWRKFIFIAPFSLVTANYDVTIGQALENESFRSQIIEIMHEIHAIARAKRIDLPEAIIDESIQKGLSFSYNTRTSFQRDYANPAKKDERDTFARSIIELGAEFRIETSGTELQLSSLNHKKPIDTPNAVRYREYGR